jgi:hypothetical protein
MNTKYNRNKTLSFGDRKEESLKTEADPVREK